jgi:hypothetical protein
MTRISPAATTNLITSRGGVFIRKEHICKGGFTQPFRFLTKPCGGRAAGRVVGWTAFAVPVSAIPPDRPSVHLPVWRAYSLYITRHPTTNYTFLQLICCRLSVLQFLVSANLSAWLASANLSFALCVILVVPWTALV